MDREKWLKATRRLPDELCLKLDSLILEYEIFACPDCGQFYRNSDELEQGQCSECYDDENACPNCGNAYNCDACAL